MTEPVAHGSLPTIGGPNSNRAAAASTVGAIIAAVAASACCVGPLVFALLGLGGAGLLVKFEPLRPYLMAATLALLGTGFYFTYRRPKLAPTQGGADCACEVPRVNRWGRVMLWVAAAFVLGLLAFPYLAPWIFE